MNGPQAHWLPDGRRLHLHHGPIDLIVEAFGPRQEVLAAYGQAVERFRTILDELVAELALLRAPVAAGAMPRLHGRVARSMAQAVLPYAKKNFITPMAAVAGAVADEVLDALTHGRQLEKAYVNNGGDVALHLSEGAALDAAVAGTMHGLADRLRILSGDDVRGLATSGWRGRSFSLGIADAVTVLAATGAAADAAATVIANAVDLPGHAAIVRRPAAELAPDSDLGTRAVTVGVGHLDSGEVAAALERGWALAERLRSQGLISAATLFLAGDARFTGALEGAAAAHAPGLAAA